MTIQTPVATFALALVVTVGTAVHAQPPGVVALTPAEMMFRTTGLAQPGMTQANLVGDPASPDPTRG